MSAPMESEARYGVVNVLGSVAWGALAWGFAWLLAFLSADAQSNAGGIRWRIEQLRGGGDR